jgi:hypothetical protein
MRHPNRRARLKLLVDGHMLVGNAVIVGVAAALGEGPSSNEFLTPATEPSFRPPRDEQRVSTRPR